MNINSAVIQGAKVLKDRFVKNPLLDSEILMTKAIKKDRKYILLNPKKILHTEDLNYFQKLIKKRSIGKPIAYLTNKKFFWDSEFIVSDDILIPRPDTELVIEKVLDLTAYKKKLNILEIGVGSGCILLSILKERKSYYGTGIDISKSCLKINDSDLRIDVFRAGGPGGQSVNTTDSAVRITHIPTGLSVSQQDEKSQHKNKAKGMKILRARLYELERSRIDQERSKDRKTKIGTGDRSERIRTYIFPQGRVTDHRINLTLHRLEEFLEGEAFDEMIESLTLQAQEESLNNLK